MWASRFKSEGVWSEPRAFESYDAAVSSIPEATEAFLIGATYVRAQNGRSPEVTTRVVHSVMRDGTAHPEDFFHPELTNKPMPKGRFIEHPSGRLEFVEEAA